MFYLQYKSPDPKIIDVFICKIRKKIDQIYGYEQIIFKPFGAEDMLFAINQGEEQNLARTAINYFFFGIIGWLSVSIRCSQTRNDATLCCQLRISTITKSPRTMRILFTILLHIPFD